MRHQPIWTSGPMPEPALGLLGAIASTAVGAFPAYESNFRYLKCDPRPG
jgi:hypothetical protein